ncbi:Multifunctional cyclase-dehydratase-3-O-methyl transferase TcmN [Anatilimnocola aggregata]|uniref:Multifunctional cyclase-dehydratase-3-O-methyl transferase TcmN n=1 Tax=Anatilimnocola aggregata TaxID=2528021 RepID=A0A517YKL1_9BACT|nr:methyltransferase [Anatilimnocola aggregata]QDU30758.1 Multifunctional cyclase-dehydratase-3-O-methyl transferase TcmN [Anatilimnocola aggregata]
MNNVLALKQMITGYWTSQAIYVAAKLELADKLASGPKSVAELAKATSTDEGALFRMLRALSSVGVFTQQADGKFALSPLADPLRKNAEDSQWAMAVMMGEEHFSAWGELLYSIQTGQGSFRKVYGEGVFDYLGKHPEQAAVFDAAMTSIHGKETALMADAYDFSQFGTLCDVGGGNGSTIATILQRNPKLKGVLFDLPHVVERAKPNLSAAGVLARCELVSGSFFEQVNVTADAIMMRHIIHDWDDAKCITILKNCRAAIGPNGKVLVVESVVPTGNEPGFVKWLDLTMLVIPEGKERTESEYRELFAAAGLKLQRVVHTAGELDILEAVPA